MYASNQEGIDSTREGVFEAIDGVLNRSEFQTQETSTLLTAIQEKIQEWKMWILDRLGGLFGSGDGVANTVIVLLSILTVALVAYAIWTVLRAYANEAAAEKISSSSSRTEVGHAPSDELARAGSLAAAGRYAEAMHALYRGVLLWLDVFGHARYDDGKTGGEYARELRSGELRRTFRSLLSAFYPVAFGGRGATSGSWDRMRSAASALGVPE